MSREFFDPTPEQQKVFLIERATLREAERLAEACEHCRPNEAEIPFDVILDHVTASDPSVTDYVLEEPAKCPNYKNELLEDVGRARKSEISQQMTARKRDQPATASPN